MTRTHRPSYRAGMTSTGPDTGPDTGPSLQGDTVERVPLDTLHLYPGNPNEGDVPAIKASILRNGFHGTLTAQASTRQVLDGNHRLIALRDLGYDAVNVAWADVNDATARRLVVAFNRMRDRASTDRTRLADLLREISTHDDGLDGTGYTDDEFDALVADMAESGAGGEFAGAGERSDATPGPSLADTFGVPPFSVLDARQGWWRKRKHHWLSIGIRSEAGRGNGLLIPTASGGRVPDYYRFKTEAEMSAGRELSNEEFERDWLRKMMARSVTGAESFKGTAARVPDFYQQKTAAEKHLGRRLANDEFIRDHLVISDSATAGGTSIFDPVLCELVYRWFTGDADTILDPFAGGSVRGVVAAALGRDYIGVDLRPEQVEANIAQWDQIRPRITNATVGTATWIAGDSAAVLTDPGRFGLADFIWTCPPYGDLERYSDDPADLSTMSASAFASGYRTILAGAVDRLAEHRFAAIVIGEARDRRGLYYGLVPQTIDAMRAAGCDYYNEAVLVSPVGSLPIRVGRQFQASRKFGKTHQNVLVFVKGDPVKASKRLGPVDLSALDTVTVDTEDDDGIADGA